MVYPVEVVSQVLVEQVQVVQVVYQVLLGQQLVQALVVFRASVECQDKAVHQEFQVSVDC